MKTLVTAELDGVWGKGSGIVLLGEWCRTRSKTPNIDGREIQVVPYHWNDRKKLRQDFERLRTLNEELLRELLPHLNRLHGVSEDCHYWRLMLGYWLNIYTTVLYDRWASLQCAKGMHQELMTFVYEYGHEIYSTADTTDFIRQAAESAEWNHAIFALLLDRIPEIEKTRLNGRLPRREYRQPSRGASLARRIYGRVAGWLKRHDRYFLISTYLPRSRLASLELCLGQFPLPYAHSTLTIESSLRTEQKFRSWKPHVHTCVDDFDIVVRECLPTLMPRVFLEDFGRLLGAARKLPWPISPKVIFTSNRHFSDDVFKAWAAEKVKTGARMVIGEHGGYGAGLFNGGHTYQLAVANRFVSTGWSDRLHPHIAAVGNFRWSGGKIRINPKGKAMLVCGIMPRYAFEMRAMMLASQVLEYFDDQFRFMAALPEALRHDVIVRLTASDYGWDQKGRWLDRFQRITFDEGGRPLWKVVPDCRLFISTYNATTYIESFSHNFPTVMFWNPGRWELKPEAEPYFAKLKDAGIYHDTPESAAAHIERIWDNVNEWWFSKPVQQARDAFCDVYASNSPGLIHRLAGILHEEARQCATSNEATTE